MRMVEPWESPLVSHELVQLAAIALAALAAGSVAYVLVVPFLSGERKASRRVSEAAAGQVASRQRVAVPQQMQMRRRQVQETIKEIEAKQSAKRRVSLRTKLMRAGLNVRPWTYYVFSAVLGVMGGLILFASSMPPIVAFLGIFVCGFGIPRWLLARRIRSRQAKFLAEFANAIDIIVRGVRSGLPLMDCMQLIAAESPEPVGGEFGQLVEQQKIGIPIGSAFERMIERMPLQEVNFFAIVIAIQAQTGGNLAEALSNLSAVLRARYRMKEKVRALSAEAKASAAIIGSLPPFVMTTLFFTAPEYISLLWTERLGQFMLMVSAVWMLAGVLVMRKMINFEI